MVVPYFLDPTATPENCGLQCGEACVMMLLSMHDLYCRLDVLGKITQPGLLGTSLQALLEAVRKLGADASYATTLRGRDQAREFLQAQAPFVAFVAPAPLHGGAPAPWAHAVVVVEHKGDNVIYHDPDGVVGGPCQSRSAQAFLDAWQQGGFTALVVQR